MKEDQALDPKLVARINSALVNTGERDRLKEMLRRKLDESGWTAQMRQACENEVKNTESVSPQELVDKVGPTARASVPDQVQREMLLEIKRFLERTL